MTNIYEQFDKAFLRVSAYTLLRAGDPIGRVAFKHPADGAGRLWCYLQVWGYPMVRGYAGGYGYDKRSAAFETAARKLTQDDRVSQNIRDAVAKDFGLSWIRQLEAEGFTVAIVID